MAERPNRRDGIARGLVLTIVAILLLSAVRVEAGLLARGIVAGGAAGGVVFGFNKTQGKLFGVLESTLSAFVDGDEEKVEAGAEEAARVVAKGALESNLVIAGGLALADRARVAKERVEGFFRGASEKVTAALAIGSDEREWYEREIKDLDPHTLSAVKKRHFVEPPAPAAAASPDPWSNRVGSPSGFGGGGQVESYEDEALVQAHAWGCWKVRTDRFSPDYPTWRARMQRRQATGASVDCGEKKDEWGTAATSVAGTRQAESEDGGSSWFKESVEKERRARPDCYGIVSDSTAAECERARREDEKWKSGEESQSEYEKALTDTLGSDQTANSTDGDYTAALSDLENREAERKAREVAERRRLEEERRAREVAERRTLEEERRAREVAERQERRERREAERRRRRLQQLRAQQEQEVARQFGEALGESLRNLSEVLSGSTSATGSGSSGSETRGGSRRSCGWEGNRMGLPTCTGQR